MNFEVGTCDVEKVKDFLEKEGIQFSEARSCHEMVVREEALYLTEERIKDVLYCRWEEEGVSEEEIERRLEILDVVTQGVIDEASLVVNEDFSFYGVQESVTSRIMENFSIELSKKIS